MRINIDPLALEQRNPRFAFLNGDLTLGMATIPNIIQINHLADF